MSAAPRKAVNGTPRVDAVSDRELLARFVRRADEAAFTEVVRRYGGLVFGVCRRILDDSHDAEDAFQATFLVLVRSARKIRKRRSLAAWLHGVALRVSSRAATRKHRLRERQVEVQDMAAGSLEEITARYEQQVLDEQLQQLPERYREPLVLHYLQGRSHQQVAAQLGLSVSAVEGRLKRGRQELRMKLIRHGVGVGAALAAAHAAGSTVQAASLQPLIAATAKAAAAHAAGQISTTLISQEAAHLAGKELAMIGTTKAATVLSVSAAALIGVGVFNAAGTSSGQGTSPAGLSTLGGQLTQDVEPARPFLLAQVAGRTGTATRAGSSAAGSPAAQEIPIAANLQPLDLMTRDDRTARIEEALVEPTTLEFPGNPLHDVMEYVSKVHQVPIRLHRSLEQAGVGADEEVTLEIVGVTLRSALSIILKDVGSRTGVPLDYVIEDQVLYIVTRTEADAMHDTRVYPLQGLPEACTPEELARVIRNTIQPGSWRPGSAETVSGFMGGAYGSMPGGLGGVGMSPPGGMSPEGSAMGGPGGAGGGGTASIEPLPGCLVITQSQRAHREIADLLRQLQRLQMSIIPEPVPTYRGGGYPGSGYPGGPAPGAPGYPVPGASLSPFAPGGAGTPVPGPGAAPVSE
jgi:RNA polymerase sigma factor (sigma-70 family)